MKKRSEIEEKYKWDLTKFYQSEKDFLSALEKVIVMLAEFSKVKGKIKAEPSLIKIIDDLLAIYRIEENIYVYAHLKFYEDTTADSGQRLQGRALALHNKVVEAVAFFKTELLELDEAAVIEVFEANGKTSYIRYIEDYFRHKEHTLSAEAEQLMAATSSVYAAPKQIFTSLNDADAKFGNIRVDKKMVELTKSNYSVYIDHPNRAVRKQAFQKLNTFYKNNINTLAAMYNAFVNGNNIRATLRGFNSYLESCLFGNEIPVTIYDTLIKTVSNNLAPLHNYYHLKKKALGLKEFHLYDIFAPIVKGYSETIPFEEGYAKIIASVRVLGNRYVEDLSRSINERWLDVEPSQGKRSGAFQWSSYDSQPYVMLNYENSLSSVQTLAHELGHAMHSFYSSSEQDYVNADYAIFVAEVASTVNEILFIKSEIAQADTNEKKLYLYSQFFEKFESTIYRQTMLAEFEKITYEKKQQGESLNATLLCSIYEELAKKYYGENVHIDEEIKYGWARIPHFYTNFYVYQYATGFSAACALAKRILEKAEEGIQKYLNFLKSGCSKAPIDLLKDAGVDMSTAKPIEDALKLFENLQKEYQEIKKQIVKQ